MTTASDLSSSDTAATAPPATAARRRGARARSAGSGGMTRRGRLVRGTVGVLATVGALEALGRAHLASEDEFPPASKVLSRAAGLAGDHDFVFVQLKATLEAWGLGMLLAVLIAVPLGLLFGTVPIVNTAARAIVEFLRPIPSVALIPLVGLILGAGLEMKVTLIVYAAVWPLLFNTLYGLRDVDPLAKETLRAFGFGPLSVLWRAVLPAAAPFIYTGIRLAASIALILAVGTEVLSGFGEGLGNFIGQAAIALGGTKDVLAGTVWAGCLGLLVNVLLVLGEKRLFHWHFRGVGK
ncbi:ABC transporter permease [Actinomadura rupiterrae]|uniref:ABC transporter permease n=1 Tax=Actinomadura rupiterrae TaxID=559627 RepID=UPI0020A5588E|nr:ABC transporter permease subunit [Actinomadura rupiterrae]MCP2336229.1 NitT/TauT family transport system permease protein [Actinomadura rupiterrae]